MRTLPWVEEFESLEAVSQTEDVRALCLRLAALARRGGLDTFVRAVQHNDDLDAATKEAVVELAGAPSFLLAVEDYVKRTRIVH